MVDVAAISACCVMFSLVVSMVVINLSLSYIILSICGPSLLFMNSVIG